MRRRADGDIAARPERLHRDDRGWAHVRLGRHPEHDQSRGRRASSDGSEPVRGVSESGRVRRPDYTTVYLATGANYPDALAGGVLAAKTHSPMFVVPPDCVPTGVLALLSSKGTKNVILLGGPLSLTPAVAALTPCSF
ncbi:cell wall-binding repeat-containing protein [Herbiconiux ginsengi]|uniref:cell wall-binding repeat-containing protein n=1 Tax=Herbiconiux ginsengi TaxID=381665 RepID=UPI0038993FB7